MLPPSPDNPHQDVAATFEGDAHQRNGRWRRPMLLDPQRVHELFELVERSLSRDDSVVHDAMASLRLEHDSLSSNLQSYQTEEHHLLLKVDSLRGERDEFETELARVRELCRQLRDVEHQCSEYRQHNIALEQHVSELEDRLSEAGRGCADFHRREQQWRDHCKRLEVAASTAKERAQLAQLELDRMRTTSEEDCSPKSQDCLERRVQQQQAQIHSLRAARNNILAAQVNSIEINVDGGNAQTSESQARSQLCALLNYTQDMEKLLDGPFQPCGKPNGQDLPEQHVFGGLSPTSKNSQHKARQGCSENSSPLNQDSWKTLGHHAGCNSLPSTSAGSSGASSVYTEDEIPDGFLFSGPGLQVQESSKKPQQRDLSKKAQRRARIRPVLRMHRERSDSSNDNPLNGTSSDGSWNFPDIAGWYSALTENMK